MRLKALINSTDKLLIVKPIDFIPKFEQDKIYSLDIKEYKNQRSLEQNRLMWAIIDEISKETGQDKNDIYFTVLNDKGIKTERIPLTPEQVKYFSTRTRGMRFLYDIDTELGERSLYEIVIGSSKFNTKEMTELVDSFIRLAHSLNIKTEGL